MQEKKYLTSNKGITLLTLTITMILMMILSFTVIINMYSYIQKQNFSNLETDITKLKEEIAHYYSKNKTLPVLGKPFEVEIPGKNVNDNENYYVIDLSKMQELNLNYGKDFEKLKAEEIYIDTATDIYFINEQSHTIYYLAGVVYNGEIYYTTMGNGVKIEDIPLASILITGDSEGEINETIQLIAKMIPKFVENTGVIWSSSDETTATINEDGLVSLIKPGEVIITARSKDVETIEVTYTINITPVIDPTDIYVALNGETLTFFNNEYEARQYAGDSGEYYGNIRGEEFTRRWGVPPNTPWINEAEQIKTINFANEIVPTNMNCYFSELNQVTKIENIERLKTSKVTSMYAVFYNCTNLQTIDLSRFNTKNVESMDAMFYGCTNLENIDVSSFNTKKVTNINSMFGNCKKLKSIDISNFNTENLETMSYLFDTCTGLTEVNISEVNTSKVTDMKLMFNGCTNLTKLDLSNFDTSNVTDMREMFYNCSKLTELNISSFDVNKVTDMRRMFRNCSTLTQLNVSNFNTNDEIDIEEMFAECSNITELDLSKFTTKAETNIKNIFNNCTKLETIYASIEKWQRGNLNAEGTYNSCEAKYLKTTDGDIFKMKLDKGWGWWSQGDDPTLPVTGWSNSKYFKSKSYILLESNKKYKLEMPGNKYGFRVRNLDEDRVEVWSTGRVDLSQNDIIIENSKCIVFDVTTLRRKHRTNR